jgi:hypothetical protein
MSVSRMRTLISIDIGSPLLIHFKSVYDQVKDKIRNGFIGWKSVNYVELLNLENISAGKSRVRVSFNSPIRLCECFPHEGVAVDRDSRK